MQFSNNPSPSLLFAEQDPDSPGLPSPAMDHHRLFVGDDGVWYSMDETDVVTPVGASAFDCGDLAACDATNLPYTADGEGCWGEPTPTNVGEAIDVLDQRVCVLEAGGGEGEGGEVGPGAIKATIGAIGAAISTGIAGDIFIPFGIEITRVTMLADQTGSIVVDIWNDSYANYPPTDGDSITASAPPTISTDDQSQDATLTGWTTTIAADSTLRFNVDSVTDIEQVEITLEFTRI